MILCIDKCNTACQYMVHTPNAAERNKALEMDFDWNNPPFNLDATMSLQRIEESFEDPFAIRLLPDSPRFSVQNRFFNLGLDGSGAGVFSVYRTNGKQLKVVYARDFESEETMFYQRKLAQAVQS